MKQVSSTRISPPSQPLGPSNSCTEAQLFGADSISDPDSIRSLDPDSESGSGSRGKKVRKKFFLIFKNFFFNVSDITILRILTTESMKNTVPGSKNPPALHQESR